MWMMLLHLHVNLNADDDDDVSLPTNQNFNNWVEINIKTYRTTKKKYLKNKNPNISIETEKIVNFHFSHYKLIIISCHNNQISNPTGIKEKILCRE